jgi:hypothetical protein
VLISKKPLVLNSQSNNPCLLYLSYGSGVHEQEVEFSIATARYQCQSNGENHPRIMVFAEHPEHFKDCPAEVVHIPAATWLDWSGRTNFNHRRKILALDHAMELQGGDTVLLDGDTWFRKPPSNLFHRLSKEQTLLHVKEGTINEMPGPKAQALKELLDSLNANKTKITADLPNSNTAMWNAGVIGLHHSQRPLLKDVLNLTDFLCERSNLHILEQLAFSFTLPRVTKTGECLDVVFHYWPPYLHKPFREKIAKIMDNAKSLPEIERLHALFRHRPRPTLNRRVVVLAKRFLEGLHIKRKSVRSNDW